MKDAFKKTYEVVPASSNNNYKLKKKNLEKSQKDHHGGKEEAIKFTKNETKLF